MAPKGAKVQCHVRAVSCCQRSQEVDSKVAFALHVFHQTVNPNSPTSSQTPIFCILRRHYYHHPSTLLFDPASCQSSTLHTKVFGHLQRDANNIAASLVSYAPTTTYCTYKGRLQFRGSSRRDPPFSKLTFRSLSPDRLEGQSVVY
jgi:hypothetical protein